MMADRLSEIDAWFNEQDEEKTLPEVDIGADLRSPDEAAAERVTAETVGEPPQAVRAYPDLYNRRAEGIRLRDSTRETPRLAEWLAQPDNAAVARDDVENLSTFERMRAAHLRGAHYRALGPAGDVIAPLAFGLDPLGAAAHIGRRAVEVSRDPLGNEQQRQGELDIEQGKLAYRRGVLESQGLDLSPEDLARLDELATRENRDDWGPFIIGPTRRLLPQIGGALERGYRQTGRRLDDWEETVYGAPTVRRLRPFGEEEDEDVINATVPRPERSLAREAVAHGIYGMGAPFAAIGGAGGGYLSFGNEMETGSAYDEMRRAGVEPEIAWQRANEYGAWATAIEFVSDATGLRLTSAGRLVARTFLRQRGLEGTRPLARAAGAVAATAGEQGAEEASQQLAQIIHQDLAQQVQATGDSDVGEAWRSAMTPEHIEAILQAGFIGAQGGAGMAAVPSSANLALDLRAAQGAERNAAMFEEMTRAAQASKLSERGLVSTLEGAVGAMDDSSVYIDADRFLEHFQGAGSNAYAVAEELGIGADNLAQAVASHGQVQVPTATFAARVLRVPKHAGLAEHARISPTDATPAEAKMAGEVFRAEIERIVQETEAAQTDNEIGLAVEQRVRELFESAAAEGGPSAAVASRYAKLVAAMPRALMARARATGDAAYAERLEGQLRKLFGERLDIAGPGRGLGSAQTAEMDQPPSGDDPVAAQRHWDLLDSILEERRNLSTPGLRRTPPDQIPEVGTREYAEATVDAREARSRGERLTPVQRALLRWEEENAFPDGLFQGDIVPDTPNSFAAINRYSNEELMAWYRSNVVESRDSPRALSLRFRAEEKLKHPNVRLEITEHADGTITAMTVFRGRTDRESRYFRQPTRAEVAKALHLFTRTMAVMRAWALLNKPRAIKFTGATEAHERLYRTVMRVMRIEGYENREVVIRGADVSKSTPEVSVVRSAVSEAGDPQTRFAFVRDDVAETMPTGLMPLETTGITWDIHPGSLRKSQAEIRVLRTDRKNADASGSPDNSAEAGGPDAGRGGDRQAGVGSDEGSGAQGTRDGELAQGNERGAIRAYAEGEFPAGVRPFGMDAFRAGEFGDAAIRMTEAADLSTFLHEFGHLGHFVLESIATAPEAPAEFQQMWANTLQWWGLTQEQWSGMDRAARERYQEQWARTFEAYLMEGQAPSLGLRESFAAFKQWLLQIYKTVLRLDARLTPEIRGVFDRLLATDEEIADARAAQGADFALAREAFATEEEFAQYQSAITEAREAQEAELRARVMDAHVRKSKRWWRAERERMRAGAARYVDSDPARRAHDWLAFEEWRPLASTEMSDEGEIGYIAPADAIEEIPEGLPPMRLAPEALAADWPDATLPVALNPRVDADTVLAEAMRLKAQDKGRGQFRAQRMGAFVRANGGVRDPDGRIKAALGSGRRRPGLINNDTGKTPEEMMALAAAAGYFGDGAAGELSQPGRSGPVFVSAVEREAVTERGFEMFQPGELLSELQPTVEEFMASLIADLTGERQVHSAKDRGAPAAAQDLEDARAWFEANEIDLSKDKETIRGQIAAALEKAKSDENAMSPDDVADVFRQFGFPYESGDELVKALSGLKPRAQAIEDEIDRRLQEEHGDAGSAQRIKSEAELAAHTEAQSRRIEMELAALQTATGGRATPVGRVAKAYAAAEVERMNIRAVRNATVFLAGERRAARAAFDAAKKGDWPEAARQKAKQLMSFHLYNAARDAAERLDRMQARWRRYSSSATTRAAIGASHIEQIDAILDSVETGRPQFRPTQTLDEWAEQLKAEDAEDLIVFDPAVIEQQIKRPLSSMSYAEVKGLDDALRNIETIGRGMIKLRRARDAQRIADIQQGLKERIQQEWGDRLAKKQSLAAPGATERAGREFQHIHAQLLKIDYLARLLDGLKDGGPWMGLMAETQDAENDLHDRSQKASQEFLGIVRDHYTPAQFRQMLSKRIFIHALDDSRTKAQIISYALNIGNEYNREALMRGEGWSPAELQAVLYNLDRNDWTFVQALWNYVAQWKEESFALDERTRGSRPPEVQATPFTTPDGHTYAGGYWPVSFSSERSDRAAQREARETIIGEYGGSFRQAATNRGRLKARAGTGGQALSDDFLGVLAKHVNDSLRDLTHRELIITLRRVKADPELRNMIARVGGRDAVRALDEWVHRLAARTPANAFGDYGRLAAYIRRAATSHAMGFKVSVATLNLLGHLQAIPRNGVLAQMKHAGLSVAVGFPDLLRRHLQAIVTGKLEVSARVRLVHEKSAMMRQRRNTFDRDINEIRGDLVGRRVGAILPKQLEDTLQILNSYTDQVVSVPTWLAAYESAKNGNVEGVSGEQASVAYADSVVRMTLSAGGTKDMAALIASNNQWQRLMTMFMGWASAFYNQLTVEQIPGVASGKIGFPRFAANMIWIWLLPAVATTMFYGQSERDDDEDDAEYWSRMGLNGVIYPLQTIPLVRDAMSALVQGYPPRNAVQTPIQTAVKLSSAIEREDERQMVKQGYMLAGQITGLPAQAYVTGDYLADWAAGEEDPTEDPVDALEEALLRDTR